MGLTFDPARRDAKALFGGAFRLLTARGTSHALNLLAGGFAGGAARVTLFDHVFRSRGSGGRSRSRRAWAAAVEFPRLTGPPLRMRPETVLAVVNEPWGRDLDFDDDPEFSRAFLLRADDEDAARAFLTPRRRAKLAALKGCHLESHPGRLLIWRPGAVRADADAVRGVLKIAAAAHAALATGRPARRSAAE